MKLSFTDDRVLAVMAHPDDEVLWASSILASAKKIIICYNEAPNSGDISQGRRTVFQDFPLKTVVDLAITESNTYQTTNWRKPEETEKVMRGDWLLTGDIATMDSDGFFRIVDRRKDMILVSGFNVFPNEVEEVLAKLAGVKECAVVGVPDGAAGEAPKAFVVRSDPGLTQEAVRAHCKKHLTGYKVPRSVEFRDELPKSNVGKILRKDLRASPGGSAS